MDRAFRSLKGGTLAIDFWDGTSRVYGRGEPVVRLKLHRAAVVPRLLLDPELAFGEAYTRGELEVEGRLEDLISLTQANNAPLPALADRAFQAAALFSRARPLSLARKAMQRNRRDVSHHYDLGNDFYKLWLDPTMTYSCAYFRAPGDDLELAQRQKVRHVLNKLRLARSETLLDVGCGWGALVADAASHFGADVLGITLSEQQQRWFEERNSLPNAKVRLEHYHALADKNQQFDKVVSVGMAEHVGRQNLRPYFADLKRVLKPGGLGLVHCITGTVAEPTNPWIVKHIFPGGYIPSFNEIVRELTRQELVVCDVENLGAHYALTLDRWADNFERNVAWVEDRYGADFVRMWRLYLRFSAASFRCEDVYVHQVLFCNGKPRELPLTREDLYSADDLNFDANDDGA